jgi:hypothetical protein
MDLADRAGTTPRAEGPLELEVVPTANFNVSTIIGLGTLKTVGPIRVVSPVLTVRSVTRSSVDSKLSSLLTLAI